MGNVPEPPKVILRSDGRPGRVVALVGGVHGNEFYGPAAVLAIAKRLQDIDVYGEIILVPTANPYAAIERTRSSQSVTGDLNRQFGTAPTSTDRELHSMAQLLWNTHLSRAEILVDLHSGGHQRMLPHARFSGNPDEILPLIGAIGIKHAMRYRSTPPGLLISRARRDGALAFALEVGGGQELNQGLLLTLSDGLWNFLIHLKCVRSTEKKLATAKPVVPGKKLRASRSGVFIPCVDVGDELFKGDIIGEFTSFASLKKTLIRSQVRGTVFQLLTGGPTSKGEILAEVVAQAHK